MTLVVRKLEILDVGQLRSLVIDHLDGIEPGLTVLDSSLQMGHANVDIVALDAEGALVLVAAGFTADEEMLLTAVEAYTWCLEYPDAVRRLYPSVDVSAARPPRLMFVVERLPDSFHRKIKQLGFSEVDCVEFRHLDVSGTAAVYFDTLARLRRGSPFAEFQPAPIARRVSEPQMRRTPEPTGSERSLDKLADHSDNVVPLVAGPSTERSTSVRTQKMLNAQGHARGAAPVIDLAARTAAAAQRVEMPAPRVEIAPRAEAVRIETPVHPIESLSARIEAPALEIEQVDEIEPAPAIEAFEASVAGAAPVIEDAEPVNVETPSTPAAQDPEPGVSFAEAAKELLEPKKPVIPAPKPVIPSIKPVAPASKPIASPAKPIAPATKPIAPASKPIASPAKPTAAAPKKSAQNLPQELDGLKFPDDGVLTRQWMEFLNQMVSGK